MKILILFFLAVAVLNCQHEEKSYEETDILSAEGEVASLPTQCDYQGAIYKVGETFASVDGCNECQCESGEKVICTLKNCKAIEEEAKKARERLKQFHRY